MKNNKKNKPIEKVPTISLQEAKDWANSIRNQIKDAKHIKTTELEYDDFGDSLKRMNKEYKIEVDWNQFDEPQIQTLIAILFQSIGYSSENWHISDRSREEGADLVIKKEKKSIAIAVKIKPKQEDRPQLLDLSDRPEKRKIYVHIQTPSKTFHNYMKKFEGKVEFWKPANLNDFFIKNNLGFTANLVLDNHEISDTITKTRIILFGLRNKCLTLKNAKPGKLDLHSLNLLWRLKDDGVSLYKTNENIIILLEKPVNIKTRQLDEHFFKIFIEYLDILAGRLNSFLTNFEIFYKRNEVLVHNSIISKIGRSHWTNLLLYKTDNSLTSLQDNFREAIQYNKILEILKNDFSSKELEKHWKEEAKNNDIWSVMENRTRNLMIFGSGIEAIVDDIFDEYLRNYKP